MSRSILRIEAVLAAESILGPIPFESDDSRIMAMEISWIKMAALQCFQENLSGSNVDTLRQAIAAINGPGIL